MSRHYQYIFKTLLCPLTFFLILRTSLYLKDEFIINSSRTSIHLWLVDNIFHPSPIQQSGGGIGGQKWSRRRPFHCLGNWLFKWAETAHGRCSSRWRYKCRRRCEGMFPARRKYKQISAFRRLRRINTRTCDVIWIQPIV